MCLTVDPKTSKLLRGYYPRNPKQKEKDHFRSCFLTVDEGGCGWYRIRQFDDAFKLRKC
jgi:hypothetical protein